MPLTGKRITEPPPSIVDAVLPPKRRKGRVLTGHFNTIPPDYVETTSAMYAATVGNDSSSPDKGTVWQWEEHTTSCQTGYKKRTVPIELTNDPTERDMPPGLRHTTTDSMHSTAYDIHQDTADHIQDTQAPRSSRGKVGCDNIHWN